MPTKISVKLFESFFVPFDEHTKKLRDRLGLRFERFKDYEKGWLKPFELTVGVGDLLQLFIDLNQITNLLILIEAVDPKTVHIKAAYHWDKSRPASIEVVHR